MPIKRKKVTTIECFCFVIRALKSALRKEENVSGIFTVTNHKKQELSGNFTLDFSDYFKRLTLRYWFNEQWLSYSVNLVPVPCRFGGHRWYFQCAVTNGTAHCFRRATKLYINRFEQFGCRFCQRLTYKSVQRHDKRNDDLLGYPWLAKKVLNGPISGRISTMALNAVFKIHEKLDRGVVPIQMTHRFQKYPEKFSFLKGGNRASHL